MARGSVRKIGKSKFPRKPPGGGGKATVPTSARKHRGKAPNSLQLASAPKPKPSKGQNVGAP